ncbi:hypothetical protein P9112_001313 [Eukaryota sp. TZLM1-RC]
MSRSPQLGRFYSNHQGDFRTKKTRKFVTSEMPGFHLEDKIKIKLYSKTMRDAPERLNKMILCKEDTTDAVHFKCRQLSAFPWKVEHHKASASRTTEEVVELWEPSYQEVRFVEDHEEVLSVGEKGKIIEEYDSELEEQSFEEAAGIS